MYIDQISHIKSNSGKTEVSEIGFVNAMGEIGKYISLDIKMIGRNKRPKTLALMSIIIVVYFGFLMVTAMKYQPAFVTVIFAVFMSCPFMLMHGQFMFNWESTYFDSLMTKNIAFKTYLKAMYYLYFAASIITITLTAIFMFFTNKDIFQFVSIGLFTLGFYAFVMFYLSIFNKSRIDLNKSAYFNYQGSGISQFILVLIGLLFPLLLKYIFDKLIGQSFTNYILCGIGLAFIVMHDRWIGLVSDAFLKRKYINLEGYRK
jgi:hypothetical protein